MKICFVVGTFPSLSETFILNQLTGLLDQGHTVRIFAGARSEDVIIHEDVIRSGLLQHVRFYQDKPRSRFVRVLMFLGMFPLMLMRHPRPTLNALNVFRYGREAASLNLFFKARAFLEVRDFDILYCHFGQNGIQGALMKDVGAVKGKVVTVFHAADITAFVEREGKTVYQRLFACASLILSISRHTTEKLIALGCPTERIRLHRMGVDLSQFHLTSRKRFGSGPLRLLSVARLVEKKGIRYALEALAGLRTQGIDASYTIVGDGPLRAGLEAHAKSLQIDDRVSFVGWKDSGAVRSYLKDADIFLSPSVRAESGDEEGIPVVLMEAMANSIPVVTTPTGGIRELVVHDETGFLVEEKSGVALTRQLQYLWEHSDTAEKAAAAGRNLIEKEYNIKHLNRQLEQVLTAVTYEKHTA